MDTQKKTHIGRNISKIRELCGMKQEALAQAMGVCQQTVSTMENNEKVDRDRLDEVAKALGVTAKGIRKFSEENVLHYISKSYDKNPDMDTVASMNSIWNFNTLDKLSDSYTENRKLYERLLDSEKEKVRHLEKMLKLK